jgi:peroxiredoxin
VLVLATGPTAVGAGRSATDEVRFVKWDGAATPPLELRDLSGKPATLTDYRGHVVLLNFWATWCEFCKDEVSSMKRLRAQLAGKPLAIVMVNYGESASRARSYAREQLPDGVRVLLDPSQDVAQAWKVRVVPSSFLIDPTGAVRYRIIGNMDWASEEAVRTVSALLP